MRFPILLACIGLVAVVTACERRLERSAPISEPGRSPHVGALSEEFREPEALLAWMDSIESLAARPGAPEQTFVLRQDRFILLRDSLDWPEDVEAEVRVLVGPDGRPLRHLEVPVSPSGDWSLALTHYFDSSGRTRAFASSGRYASPPGCGGRILRDLRRTLYDPQGQILHANRVILNEEGQPVDEEKCGHLYDFFEGGLLPTYEALVQAGRAPPL